MATTTSTSGEVANWLLARISTAASSSATLSSEAFTQSIHNMLEYYISNPSSDGAFLTQFNDEETSFVDQFNVLMDTGLSVLKAEENKPISPELAELIDQWETVIDEVNTEMSTFVVNNFNNIGVDIGFLPVLVQTNGWGDVFNTLLRELSLSNSSPNNAPPPPQQSQPLASSDKSELEQAKTYFKELQELIGNKVLFVLHKEFNPSFMNNMSYSFSFGIQNQTVMTLASEVSDIGSQLDVIFNHGYGVLTTSYPDLVVEFSPVLDAVLAMPDVQQKIAEENSSGPLPQKDVVELLRSLWKGIRVPPAPSGESPTEGSVATNTSVDPDSPDQQIDFVPISRFQPLIRIHLNDVPSHLVRESIHQAATEFTRETDTPSVEMQVIDSQGSVNERFSLEPIDNTRFIVDGDPDTIIWSNLGSDVGSDSDARDSGRFHRSYRGHRILSMVDGNGNTIPSGMNEQVLHSRSGTQSFSRFRFSSLPSVNITPRPQNTIGIRAILSIAPFNIIRQMGHQKTAEQDWVIHAELFNAFSDTIAHGALAYLYALPSKEWFSADLALYHKNIFMDGCNQQKMVQVSDHQTLVAPVSFL